MNQGKSFRKPGIVIWICAIAGAATASTRIAPITIATVRFIFGLPCFSPCFPQEAVKRKT